MKHYIVLLFIILFVRPVSADRAIGTWKSFPAYSFLSQIESAKEKVYSVSWGNLFSYNIEDQSISLYTKENGLNDATISKIKYDAESNQLLIAYENANIDIIENNGDKIYNIPDLMNKTLTASKTINDIYFHKERAYVSTNFGILVINMKKKEVAETYTFNQKVINTIVRNDDLYALTEKGIYRAQLKNNLIDMNNWVLTNSQKNITEIILFNEQIYALTYGKSIGRLENDNTWSIVKEDLVRDFIVVDDLLYFYTPNALFSIDRQQQLKSTPVPFSLTSLSYNRQGHNFWGCEQNGGLFSFKLNADQHVEITALPFVPNSPMINTPFNLTFDRGYLYVAGGGRWADRYHRMGAIMKWNNESWYNYPVDSIRNAGPLIDYRDIINIVIDPDDPNHLFAGSYGDGLYEFMNDKFVKLHTYNNSGLETILPNTASSYQYIRVDALSYDKDKNLWMSNNEVRQSIKVLKKDGTWTALYYDDLARQEVISHIFHTQNNHKWITIPRGKNVGLFILDTNNDLTDFSKHKTVFFKTFTDTEGKTIAPNGVYCVAQDKRGTVWVGTDKGPLLFQNPNRVFDNNYRCSRVKVPLEDINESDNGTVLAEYLLENEQINCIKIDDANRKWIGTANTGVYLLSEDGKYTIHHFTKENSPLPSNNILSLAINSENGEVFIGTDIGLYSYTSDATEGKEDYNEVNVFPNPVKPDYEGPITIRGLKENSEVTITDIQGRALYSATSLGGEIVWDGKGNNAERVSSGVYLVMCATSEGKKGVVAKIVVIK